MPTEHYSISSMANGDNEEALDQWIEEWGHEPSDEEQREPEDLPDDASMATTVTGTREQQ